MDVADPDRVKFRSWAKVIPPPGLSRLHWAIGIGWIRVAIIAAATVGVIALPWYVGIVAALVLFVVGGSAVLSLSRWNSSGWRSIHQRGMMLYSGVAGLEVGRSQSEGRQFNNFIAFKDLIRIVCPDAREADVQALVRESIDEGNVRLITLFVRDLEKKQGPIPADKLTKLRQSATTAQVSPALVLLRLVENTFGSEEAGRYAAALISGNAT